MKRIALLSALIAAIALAGAAAPADAGIRFDVRIGGITAGGLHFDFGVHARGPGYRSGYFYRSARPVPVAYGHTCSDLCYRSRDAYYHSAACPLVLRHFRSHGVAPPVLGAYGGVRGPRYDAGVYGYRDYRGYEGHGGRGYRTPPPPRAYERYDPRWRSRYDRRDRLYDRRGRYEHSDRYDARRGRWHRDRRDHRHRDGCWDRHGRHH